MLFFPAAAALIIGLVLIGLGVAGRRKGFVARSDSSERGLVRRVQQKPLIVIGLGATSCVVGVIFGTLAMFPSTAPSARAADSTIPAAAPSQPTAQPKSEDIAADSLAGSVWTGELEFKDEYGLGLGRQYDSGPMILVIHDAANGKLQGTLEWPELGQRNEVTGTAASGSLSFTEQREAPAPKTSFGRLPSGEKVERKYTAQLASSGQVLSGSCSFDEQESGAFRLQRLPAESGPSTLAGGVWSGAYEAEQADNESGIGLGGPMRRGGYPGGALGDAPPTHGPMILAVEEQLKGKLTGTLQRPLMQGEESVPFTGTLFSDGSTLSLTIGNAKRGAPGAPDANLLVTLNPDDKMQGAWVDRSGRRMAFLLDRLRSSSTSDKLAGTVWKGEIEPPTAREPVRGMGRFGSYGDEEMMAPGNQPAESITPMILVVTQEIDGKLEGVVEWPELGRRFPLTGLVCRDGKTLTLSEDVTNRDRQPQTKRQVRTYAAKVDNGKMTLIHLSTQGQAKEFKLQRVDGETSLPNLAGTYWSGELEFAGGNASSRDLRARNTEQGKMVLAIHRHSEDHQVAGHVEWPDRNERHAFQGWVSHDGSTIAWTETRTNSPTSAPGAEGEMLEMKYGAPGYGNRAPHDMETGALGAAVGYEQQYIATIDKNELEGEWRRGELKGTLRLQRMARPAPIGPLVGAIWTGEMAPAADSSSGASGSSDSPEEMILVVRETGERELAGRVEWPQLGRQDRVSGYAFADGAIVLSEEMKEPAASPPEDHMGLYGGEMEYAASRPLSRQYRLTLGEEKLRGVETAGGKVSGNVRLQPLPAKSKRVVLPGTSWTGAFRIERPKKQRRGAPRNKDDTELATETVNIMFEQESANGVVEGTIDWGRDGECKFQGVHFADNASVYFTFQTKASANAAARQRDSFEGLYGGYGEEMHDLRGRRRGGAGVLPNSRYECFAKFNAAERRLEVEWSRGGASANTFQAVLKDTMMFTMDLEQMLPEDSAEGFAVIHSSDELDRALDDIGNLQALWARAPKSLLTDRQIALLEAWIERGGVLWTDTDFLEAFGFEPSSAPTASQRTGTAHANRGHFVFRGLTDGAVAFAQSSSGRVAHFLRSQRPEELTPLMATVEGDTMTACAAVKRRGAGWLVVFPSRLGGESAEKCEEIARDFLRNLRACHRPDR